MKADAVAFACSIGQPMQDVMFSHCPPLFYCTDGNVWSVIFSTLNTKFPCPVYCQTSKTIPAQPCLNCCLTAPNPPSTPTPSKSSLAAKKRDPTQNLEDFTWWLFLCCSLCLSPSLCICPLIISQWTFKQIAFIGMKKTTSFYSNFAP